MKTCFKCNKEKPLSDFYKHNKMSDGYVNKCKECAKGNAKNDYYRNMESEYFAEKERIRAREKYKRLNYSEKRKNYFNDKPWFNSVKYRNLNRKLKIPKGYELHHWSYNDDDLQDVFIMKMRSHKRAHAFLKFDIETKKFKTLDGLVLETKKDHLKYLLDNDVIF